MAVSEQEFLELQGLVIKLRDELSQTKALQDQLMQNGLSDLLTGHGFQRYTNNMRLGRGGIQIEAPSPFGVSGIWFVPELEPDPSTADVTKSYVTGSAQSTGASFLNINALDNDPSSAPTVRGTAYVETEGSADRAFAGLEVAVDGDLTAGGEWAKAELVRSYSSDAGRFQLYQALLGLHPGDGAGYTMGDPSNAIEGDIWYNTTDNQFKFYEGSSIKTLGGGGMGIITNPRDWATGAGYEYWLVAGADSVTAAGATNPSGLDGWGWTVSAITQTDGSTADFNSTSDRDPTRFTLADASDLLRSPQRFGSAEDFLIAARLLGSTPTKLCWEALAQFATASNNETGSCIGFGDSGSPAGTIRSNGTNFVLASGTTDTGATVDTSWHIWRVEVGSSTTEWFIDDVSQGTVTTGADRWPQFWQAAIQTSNDINVAWVRVFYE